MEDILKKIKAERILQLEREREQMKTPALTESLLGGFHENNIAVLAEIKRASPSKGTIASKDFDLLQQAKHYQKNGASGFSILTEESYFNGDNAFIPQVKKKFPQIPILRKDFIFNSFQVFHAKLLGASAILLIVAMLDDEELLSLHKLALELDLEVLVEVHNYKELVRALYIPQLKLLGFNNRNLKTFDVNLRNSKTLMEHFQKTASKKLKENLVLVSESGYSKQEDIEFAKKWGFHAVLIGEALMKGNIFVR